MTMSIHLVAILLIFVMAGCVHGAVEFKKPPGESFAGPLPPLTEEQKQLTERLRADVKVIGGDIGDRNIWNEKGLNATIDYIKKQMTDLGYTVGEQPYQAQGKKVMNLDAELKGSTKADEIFVIGAHYDSCRGQPAANDNGSGVAAVLQMARTLKDSKPERTIRFVFFVNEEPPFSWTDSMGSVVYAKRCKERKENIVGMISMETIGFYSDEKGSQKYPAPFDKYFPSEGNFIGFVGDIKSERLVTDAIGAFRKLAKFPSQGIAASPEIEGIGYSDHWSFWQQGYQAIMVTDTAMFRYPHYHTKNDTPDKLDYERMARVVEGVTEVVRVLTGVK